MTSYRSNRPSPDARLCSQCHGSALACEACDASGWQVPMLRTLADSRKAKQVHTYSEAGGLIKNWRNDKH
jgi:hypothetical protein